MTTPTNMPPLPEPCGLRNEYCDQFTWEQMHAYAQAHAAQQVAALASTSTQNASAVAQERVAWNRRIRDAVDALLEQAGYQPDSSLRNSLGCMNFDTHPETPPPVAGDADTRQTLIYALVASKGWNHGYAAAVLDDYFHSRATTSKQEGA